MWESAKLSSCQVWPFMRGSTDRYSCICTNYNNYVLSCCRDSHVWNLKYALCLRICFALVCSVRKGTCFFPRSLCICFLNVCVYVRVCVVCVCVCVCVCPPGRAANPPQGNRLGMARVVSSGDTLFSHSL